MPVAQHSRDPAARPSRSGGEVERAPINRIERIATTVLNTIDRYLLRQILATCAVMTGIGLVVLLLERVLHLFGLVANANKAFSYVGQMLLLLTPTISASPCRPRSSSASF